MARYTRAIRKVYKGGMRMKRKNISKKLRFELFKRDSFTCQYCGNKAPEVTLEIDHIEPVSKGGDNNIMNLVTSCFDCNRGKSDRRLEDNEVIEKQNEQLQALNERKMQLEMMLEWRTELLNMDNDLVDSLSNFFVDCLGGNSEVNEIGLVHLKKWVKKYKFDTLLQAIEKSTTQYGNDVEKSFKMIPKIAYYIENPQEDYMKDLFYIRGIARNRFDYFNDRAGIVILKNAYVSGVEIEDLKSIALHSKNWSDFKSQVEEITETHE